MALYSYFWQFIPAILFLFGENLMIPDFPKEKEKLMKYWNRYLAAKNKELMGFLGKIPTHANHEGHMWDLIQSDGSTHSQPYHEIEGMLTLEISEIPNLTPDKIRQKLDQIAEVIARQMSQKMFEEINRVTSEAGNLVNARGQPFTKELFLQMIEKIDMDFDENGNLKPPALIMNPDLW